MCNCKHAIMHANIVLVADGNVQDHAGRSAASNAQIAEHLASHTKLLQALLAAQKETNKLLRSPVRRAEK